MPFSVQPFPILALIGVAVQFGGALMLLGLFLMLRRFVLRRAYFSAWVIAWGALAVAIGSLVIRYFLVPGLTGRPLSDNHPVVRLLYFVYQASKAVGFVYFLRGTIMYVGGTTAGAVATRRLWIAAALFAVISTLASARGLNEMVVWQSAIAVPVLAYCASALLWLPRPRRTVGSVAAGACFGLLAVLWLNYAGAFGLVLHAAPAPASRYAVVTLGLNTYFDLVLDVLLGYAMVLILMEDAKREVDDAQAELRLTHDQLRRAALYDALTDLLNRRAFTQGVGMDMVKATFGTVVLADVDNLKMVNDRYGHAAGDLLLRRCAEVMRATLRPYDKLYRWGGDEFLLVVPRACATDVLARLEGALEGAEPLEAPGSSAAIPLQMSLGAADYASSEDLATSIESADRAMYQEKARRKTARGVPTPESAQASLPAGR